MKKREIVAWWCIGVMSHDVVSAYFPDGGHIPGLHAWYFALPLLALCLAWGSIFKRRSTAPPNPSAQPPKGVYA